MADAAQHWEYVYEKRASDEVSWFEDRPAASLAMVGALGRGRDAAIIDVGGGASRLAGELVGRGYTDITVTDLSEAALEAAQARLGQDAGRVDWVAADVREHNFGRQFDIWHDRAAFHFMVEPDDRDRYLVTLKRSLRPGGDLIIATFGPSGPTECSGLPVHRYGADELEKALGADFELGESELQMHETPSGREQQFLWARFRREA